MFLGALETLFSLSHHSKAAEFLSSVGYCAAMYQPDARIEKQGSEKLTLWIIGQSHRSSAFNLIKPFHYEWAKCCKLSTWQLLSAARESAAMGRGLCNVKHCALGPNSKTASSAQSTARRSLFILLPARNSDFVSLKSSRLKLSFTLIYRASILCVRALKE